MSDHCVRVGRLKLDAAEEGSIVSSDEDIALWDAAATAYAGFAGQSTDSFARRFVPFLAEQVGDPAGQHILDVGCGHGWLAKNLNEQGAIVTAIDGSRSLIDIARAGGDGVRWLLHDLSTGLPDGLSDADAAIAHMVLMDLPELNLLLANLHAALRPGGTFVFTLLHPSFFRQSPIDDGLAGERYRKVTGYLAHERWWIDSYGGHLHYHRPLQWYVQALVRHGFVITGLSEPPSLPHDQRPEAEWTEYERWFAQIPTMIALSARRA